METTADWSGVGLRLVGLVAAAVMAGFANWAFRVYRRTI
jgi:hypothetical protein